MLYLNVDSSLRLNDSYALLDLCISFIFHAKVSVKDVLHSFQSSIVRKKLFFPF